MCLVFIFYASSFQLRCADVSVYLEFLNLRILAHAHMMFKRTSDSNQALAPHSWPIAGSLHSNVLNEDAQLRLVRLCARTGWESLFGLGPNIPK